MYWIIYWGGIGMKMKELHEDIIDNFIRFVSRCLIHFKTKQSWGRKVVSELIYENFSIDYIKENSYYEKFFNDFRPFILKELSTKTVYNQKEITILFRMGAKKYISSFKEKTL